uniref:Male-enhanced antigen 1 n=1 Tax=Acrobeloides nanus TaxID=290746 RepID=A0A914DTX1_9BILA
MVPTPENNDRVPKDSSNDDDAENYARDGWRIGYEVHMEGVGMVNVYGASDDSDSDGYEGPGDVSDTENAEIRRAGYQAIPSLDEPNSGTDEEISGQTHGDYAPLPSSSVQPSIVSPHIQKEFQKMLDDAPNVHLNEKNLIEEPDRSIELNDEKISVIKSTMSQIQLATPSWANYVGDKKLTELLEQIKQIDGANDNHI